MQSSRLPTVYNNYVLYAHKSNFKLWVGHPEYVYIFALLCSRENIFQLNDTISLEKIV